MGNCQLRFELVHLIRQYLPKSSSFEGVSNEEIEQIEFALNHRPRKTLG